MHLECVVPLLSGGLASKALKLNSLIYTFLRWHKFILIIQLQHGFMHTFYRIECDFFIVKVTRSVNTGDGELSAQEAQTIQSIVNAR